MNLVWYAAYGSNLSRARFDIYLRGGTPEGATHTYPGCRDLSAPLDDRPAEIDAELCFGGTSKTWGGGVAFIRASASSRAKVRLYLITEEQFADVLAQENWLEPGSVGIGSIEGAMYGEVLELGSLDGDPIYSITQSADTALAPPSDAYVHHIAVGLRETHDMPDEAIRTYLLLR